jgi:hypothetical protein
MQQKERPLEVKDLFTRRQRATHNPGLELGKETARHLLSEGLSESVGKLTPAAAGLGAVWHLLEGLSQIGRANLEGRELAHDRNFVSGFFLTLKTALANPALAPERAQAAARLEAPWVKQNEQLAKLDPRRRDFHTKNVRAFDEGSRAALQLLKRMTCTREELIGKIQRAGGFAALYLDAEQRGSVR